ncbi:MAG TPA: NYN domain-containing protein [Candidatus Saccharimonas sp.]|nr:NYN domain-containing protein [Candidatus Saccharimonas sp.]
MNDTPTTNYAFIDSQNLNLSVQQLGWKLDFSRFRRYLKDKYNVSRAFIFVGFVEDNQDLYNHLAAVGYELIFKPTLEYKDGTTKGNVDAELVLHTMIEWPHYHQAVIVSGDGDFYSLIEHLIRNDKLSKLVIPNKFNYSSLLKRFDPGYLAFVSDLRSRMTYVSRKPKPAAEGPAETPQTNP